MDEVALEDNKVRFGSIAASQRINKAWSSSTAVSCCGFNRSTQHTTIFDEKKECAHEIKTTDLLLLTASHINNHPEPCLVSNHLLPGLIYIFQCVLFYVRAYRLLGAKIHGRLGINARTTRPALDGSAFTDKQARINTDRLLQNCHQQQLPVSRQPICQ